MTTTFIPAFLNLGTGEIIIIAFVILLLFGGRKIPELMRGLGRGVRGFRQGMSEISDESQASGRKEKESFNSQDGERE